jgi:NAD(P)-dependent dehydrogenase (short-subunit alcohol dehydrogenase family)
MPARLHGRTALVTGSTDGIGAAIAATLAGATRAIASAVAFLASDEASSIHGATLSVDGGLSAV